MVSPMTKAACPIVAAILVIGALTTIGKPLEAQQPEFTAEQIEFFEKQIRPLLVERCYKCHGGKKHEGHLHLDSRAGMLKGGNTGPAVVPGKVDEGELLLAISYDPNGYQMPPDGKLPDGQIAAFRKWVEMGAPWPEETKPKGNAAPDRIPGKIDDAEFARRAKHWSFQPLTRPPIPKVSNPEWCRTPIDRFLLARLDEAGLSPADQADKRTWLRRVYFDTIGLPPTSEEIHAFIADDGPGAEERVIDRLLGNPHFGERWGRHWLDLVRYAESRGHEFDYDVANPWHYCDYVIRAINEDLPYDRFVVEHIAGDLCPRTGDLPPDASSGATCDARYTVREHPMTGANESIVATGWWHLGEWLHSPVDIRQDEADRFENMIDVYSKTFLGLTVACARCHDHKFDPITQKDYYALQGYLQSSGYRQARFETMEHNRRIAEKLDQLECEAAPLIMQAFAEAVDPVVDDLDEYLMAARHLIQQGVELREKQLDIIFEDFESGTYDNWTIEGDAFGDKPQTLQTIPDYQGKINAVGKYFVNSHQRRDGGRGDAHIGVMTSKPFTIERGFIRLWVGGGSYSDQTAVLLMIDNAPVRHALGNNDNRMHLVEWDVRDLIGRQAVIRAIDNVTGSWGNIGFDEVVFSDDSRTGRPSMMLGSFTEPSQHKIRAAAKAFVVKPQLLAGWAGHLLTIKPGEFDPFSNWAASALGDSKRIRQSPLENAVSYLPMDPFSGGFVPENLNDTVVGPGDFFWTSSGFRRNRSRLQVSLAGSGPVLKMGEAFESVEWRPSVVAVTDAQGTQHEPGALEPWQLGHILYTPTFEIRHGHLHFYMRGGVNYRIAIDSHVLIKGPLHGTLANEVPAGADPSGWHWVDVDVSRYEGHRAHVEFVPRPGEDFAIACLVQGDNLSFAPPAARPRSTICQEIEALGWSRESPRTLARLQQKVIADEIAGLNEQAKDFTWMDGFGTTVAYDSVQRFLGPFDGLPSPNSVSWILEHHELFEEKGNAIARKMGLATREIREKTKRLLRQVRRKSGACPAMMDLSPEDEYVFLRGNWKKPGDTVQRSFLQAFPRSATSSRFRYQDHYSGSGRYELALQMVDPQQTPILPRVIVNRVWQHYFGRGIVATPDDFGHLGQAPSHPELLDWLASELVEHNWSLKHIHRLILSSAAYRMASEETSVQSREPRTPKSKGGNEPGPQTTASVHSSSPVPHSSSIDPNNLLLHRMNVKRLEGEIIRDAVLTVSGRLDERMYGKSTPVHLTPFMEGRGRPSVSGPVDGDGRRSIYIAVRRNFPDPFFQAFDFPNPHSTIGRRTVSNVPAQALALMNNPLIVEQSELWAKRTLAVENRTAAVSRTLRVSGRLDALCESAYGRLPTDSERAFATAFLEQQAASYGCSPEDVRVWADLCHVLINVKEFIFVR